MSSSSQSMGKRVQCALAAAPGHRLQGHRLAAAAGTTAREFHKRAAILVARGLVTREKMPEAGHSYFWYSLTEEQLYRARLVAALAGASSLAGAALVIDDVDLPGRLSFLRMLREKTVFRDHAVLTAIIADYERTARMRKALQVDR